MQPVAGENSEQTGGDRGERTEYAFGIKSFRARPHVVRRENNGIYPGGEIRGRIEVGRTESGYRNEIHDQIISDQYTPENPELGFARGFYKDDGADKKNNRNSWQHAEKTQVLEIKFRNQIQQKRQRINGQ